jgi:hypothetical protein
MKNPVYYEKKPRFPSADAWIAPEHWHAAKTMVRIRGVLQIDEHPIFLYSRENPPWFLLKPTLYVKK